MEESEELPALVVTDVNMPGTTGLELLGRLKLSPRFAAIPVVVWSTATTIAEMSRALHLSAASYVVKPVRMSDYTLLVSRMLRCREQAG